MAQLKSPRKPDSCPKCGSRKVAKILYGMPVFNDELEQALKAGRIVLGGCCVSDDDPIWACVECQHNFGHRTVLRQSRQRVLDHVKDSAFRSFAHREDPPKADITRCTRRALMLGEGADDRMLWIDGRLRELAEIFSIAVGGFSVSPAN